ncbi:MAG: transketolase family protein [Kiritimatiellia bacterium]
MRKAFVDALIALAQQDERVMLLTADLGYSALEPFAEVFPNRFFNMGVAEQNMLAVATGLAEAGFVPFCYSIVNFATLRPFEFIRNGPVLHRWPVRIVGVGGGIEYPTNGASHYGLEDVGALRVLPDLAIYAPADSAQTRQVIATTANTPGPVYYRIGKTDLTVPGLDGRFTPGCPEHLVQGRDVLLLSLGGVATTAVAAAQTLAAEGIAAGVGVVSSLYPVDVKRFASLLCAYPIVVTVEAHFRVGALGSLTAEIIAEQALPIRLVRCAVASLPDGITGNQAFMYDRYAIGPTQLATAAWMALGDAAKGKRSSPSQ